MSTVCHTLQLVIPGATSDQIGAGLAEARHHLDFVEFDPAEGYRDFSARVAWLQGEGSKPAPLEIQAALIFGTCLVSPIHAAIGFDSPRPEGIRLLVRPRPH